MKKLLGLGLVCAMAVLSSLATAPAADKPATGDKPKKEGKPLPFNGKLTAVDKTAKTITVGERVFQVTADTKIMKDDKPATLDDGKVGEQVRGSYKSAEGKLDAVSIFFGPKAAKPKKTETK